MALKSKKKTNQGDRTAFWAVLAAATMILVLLISGFSSNCENPQTKKPFEWSEGNVEVNTILARINGINALLDKGFLTAEKRFALEAERDLLYQKLYVLYEESGY